MVVKQLADLLHGLEQCKKFDEIMDMLDNREPGSNGKFGPFFIDDEE